jgi:uncharacterized membrane protein YkvA (DUF1232 family)
MKNLNPLLLYHKAFRNENTRFLVIIVTIIYILSPIDIIPDFIFGIGLIDDILLMIMFITELLTLFVEKKVMPRFKKNSNQKPE